LRRPALPSGMKRRLHDLNGLSPTSARSSQKQWVAEVLESRAVEFLIVFFVMVDAVLVLIEAGVQDHLFCVGGRVAVCPPAAALVERAAMAQTWPPQGAVQSGLAPSVGRRAGLRTGMLAAGQDWQLSQPHPSEHVPYHVPHSSGSSGHASGHGADEGGLCPHPGEQILVCDTKDGHNARHLTHVCHVMSVSILCAFVVELSLKWWSNPQEFTSNFYHKLDLAVTVVSLLMDTVVYAAIESYRARGHERRGEEAEISLFVLTALLILARTWRIIRICHGIFEEFHIVVDEEVARLEEARASSGAGLEGADSCKAGGPTAARPAD